MVTGRETAEEGRRTCPRQCYKETSTTQATTPRPEVRFGWLFLKKQNSSPSTRGTQNHVISKQIFYSREEATCLFYTTLGLNQVCSSYLELMHFTDLDFGGEKNKPPPDCSLGCTLSLTSQPDDCPMHAVSSQGVRCYGLNCGPLPNAHTQVPAPRPSEQDCIWARGL